MKTITSICRIPAYNSKTFELYFDNMRLGVFDIETMGLNPARCPMILAGFMEPSPEGTCTIRQYFAQTPEEEPEIIERLKEDFSKVDCLLTYNGRNFDIPYVERRAIQLGLDPIECNIYNLDLLLFLRSHSQLRLVLKNLKQKTVEEYMGFSDIRSDTISGGESVKLYQTYLRCINPVDKKALENKILLHNHDDVQQLYKLLSILKQTDIHAAFTHLGFPVKASNGWPALTVSSVKTAGSIMAFGGKYRGEPFSFMSFDTPSSDYFCEFAEDRTFSFSIRLDNYKGNSFILLKRYLDSYDNLTAYPGCSKGFLLVSAGKNIQNLQVNMFIKEFLHNFMDNNLCPAVNLI